MDKIKSIPRLTTRSPLFPCALRLDDGASANSDSCYYSEKPDSIQAKIPNSELPRVPIKSRDLCITIVTVNVIEFSIRLKN